VERKATTPAAVSLTPSK